MEDYYYIDRDENVSETRETSPAPIDGTVSYNLQVETQVNNIVSRTFNLDPLGDSGIAKGFRSDIFEQLKSVKFPSEVARMADEEYSVGDVDVAEDGDYADDSAVGEDRIRPGINSPQVRYESLCKVTTRNNQKTFLDLFPNRFASCIKRGKDGDWRETSQFHHLSDDEMIESIEGRAPFLRACMADKETRLIVVMIERDSYYRTIEGLAKIRDCLQCIGVNQLKLFVSDESEQWQLFGFFAKPVDSTKVSSLLSSWLRRNGIVPGTAGVSLFPGPDPFCFPLQKGFAWINDSGHTIVARNEVSPEAALALFIADMERTEIDGDELIERLDQVLNQ